MSDYMSHPAVNPETLEFWKAMGQGKLLIKGCQGCGEAHFYPRAHCPHCDADETHWLEASGRGTIYSFTVMRREEPQRIVAYVTLEEGPTIFTNIVGTSPGDVRIGAPVHLQVSESKEGLPVPTFAM